MSVTAKNLCRDEFFYGHKACAGCGGSLAVRNALKVLGKNAVAVLPAGCMSAVGFNFPQLCFANNAIISTFAGTASMLTGIEAGFRARGIKESVVIWKHALKNALPPIVTVLGLQLAQAFTGAILTESIFSWPGMGTMIVSAIDNRDYQLIQGTVLFIAVVFVVVNLLVDVVYMLINPREMCRRDRLESMFLTCNCMVNPFYRI